MNEDITMIKVENIKKRYMIKRFEDPPKNKSEKIKRDIRDFISPKAGKEPFWALDDVSFEVKKGEKIGIIGKNGAGKSTLLKILSRITEPTEGRIELLGRLSSMLEVGTGFNGELTGRENTYLNGAILGMTREEIDKKFNDIMEFSEIGKFIDVPVKRYSSGMFVRLAFAVASFLEPDILLVDEVLAVGDLRFQKKCIDRMLKIASSGKTILFVSHQMETIRRLCDRVIVLKEGRIIFDGDVDEGIRVYNMDSYIERKNHYNYEGLARPQGYYCDTLEIKSVDIIGNDSLIYGAFDPIEFIIHCEVKKPGIGDLSLRMPIWRDDESAVAVSFSKTFADIEKTGNYSFRVRLNRHNLAPGSYFITLTLTHGSSVNTNGNLDQITKAFPFDVLHDNGTEHRWLREWGNVRCDDVDVTMDDCNICNN